MIIVLMLSSSPYICFFSHVPLLHADLQPVVTASMGLPNVAALYGQQPPVPHTKVSRESNKTEAVLVLSLSCIEMQTILFTFFEEHHKKGSEINNFCSTNKGMNEGRALEKITRV